VCSQHSIIADAYKNARRKIRHMSVMEPKRNEVALLSGDSSHAAGPTTETCCAMINYGPGPPPGDLLLLLNEIDLSVSWVRHGICLASSDAHEVCADASRARCCIWVGLMIRGDLER
jgi:hypothetical protein